MTETLPAHPWQLAGKQAPQPLSEAPWLAPRDAEALVHLFAAMPELRDVSLAQELGQALAQPSPPAVIMPRQATPTTDTAAAEADASEPLFKRPQAIVALADATLLVADRDRGLIHRLSPTGELIATFGAEAGLVAPMSIAARSDGSVVVADFIASALCIFAPATGELVAKLQAAEVMMPKGCVELAGGDMVVSSYGSRRLVLWRRDDTFSNVELPAGVQENFAPGALAVSPDRLTVYVQNEQGTGGGRLGKDILAVRFDGNAAVVGVRPVVRDIMSEGLEVLPNGSLLVSCTVGCVICHYSCDVNGEPIGVYGAGKGTEAAEYDYPVGLCAVPCGRVVVCDKRNQRLQVFTPAARERASGAPATT